jgi:hypothetical protein
MAVAATNKAAFKEFFSPIQVGVAVPGGVEISVHAACIALEDPEWVVCEVDSVNAYNTIRRAKIAAALAADFPSLLPLFELCHGAPSHLRVRMEDGTFQWLQSQEGVQQGDVLGPFFFAVGLQPVLRRVAAAHPSVALSSYLDDALVFGNRGHAGPAAHTLAAELPTVGLVPHLGKSFVFGSQPVPDSLFPEGMTMADPAAGVRVLGAPVGSLDFQAKFVADKLAQGVKAAMRAASLPNKQAALHLLRYCCVSRPVMLLRTVPPQCTAAAAAAYDDGMRQALAALMGVRGLDEQSEAWRVATLPLRPGLGCALATSTAAPAYAASWSAFLAVQPAFFPQLTPLLPTILSSTSVLATAAAAARTLVAEGRAAKSSPTGGDVVAKLQNSLALIAINARRKQLLTNASHLSAARLHSAAGQGASAWLTAIPSIPALRLSNTAFTVCLATHLGLPLPIAMPRFCKCGAPADSLGNHFAACKHLGGAILRHDRVVGLVAQLASAAGVIARKEQSHVIGENKRLDLVLREYAPSGRDVAIDVKIVHPLAEGHLAHAATHPQGTARRGEAQKVAKYGALCVAQDIDFVPTVWESFGSAAPTTISFFRGLASRVDRDEFAPPNWAASTPSSYWLQRLSVTLHRYNAYKAMNLAACGLNQPLPSIL